MTHISQRSLGAAKGRRDGPRWVDSYRSESKLPPAVCSACGACHWQGRWRWDEAPPGLVPVVCPACQRIRDGVAAHVLEITGEFGDCWDEVRGIVHHVEVSELHEHPLERVMAITPMGSRVQITTTGMHVARRLAAALLRAFRHRVYVGHSPELTQLHFAATAHA